MPLNTTTYAFKTYNAVSSQSSSKSDVEVLVGADPEVFFAKDGEPYPAIGLVGGTKDSPKPYGLGHVQEDNVMAEFNIPPSKTEAAFSNRINGMLINLEKIAAENNCTLLIQSYAHFNAKDLLHPQAQAIGCDPDYNAWTLEKNVSASPRSLGTLRTASGHVHIGLPNPNIHPSIRPALVKACDLFLGVPATIIDPDVTRRKYYGKAGCFRPKAYGVEYRVLGNFWLTKDEYRRWVFRQVIKAVNLVLNTNHLKYFESTGIFNSSVANRIINKGDIDLAHLVMKKVPDLCFPDGYEIQI